MFEMLLKSLGITPEKATGYIDEFRNMAVRYENRLVAMEKQLADISAHLRIEDKENV